ncbi:hypothetical protein SOVF_109430 [Spinacia oleracea]|uniref:DUF3741 domain-containing protein n=1 Tax=Spinacia oleracea TaxID=3562 RepID=A0A9R0I2U6_SPIOL|nr:uncharacterized protein LOC110782030 [Spinacia oleracea]KNA14229.1 hypothetical protein SOVF_109430 [Spinacia oleracea]
MLDSGTKHPENRIHLYDPVGLLNDGYGSFRPSSHATRPKRHTVSYDNFVETSANNNSGSGLGSYDSFTDANSTGGLRSYDSFEVDSLVLRSYDDSSFNLDTANGGKTTTAAAPTTTTATADHDDKDRNDGGLRFIVVNIAVEDDQSDDSTPRLWGPKSPRSPKSRRSPLHQSTTAVNSVNSSSSLNHQPSSPKSSAVNSVNSSSSLNHHQPSSPKSVNFSPMNPTIVKSVVNPQNSTTINQQQYLAMSPSSRTQAIAKGRKELMDMVKDLPESFYELSLRDIVDQKSELPTQKEKEIDIPEEKKAIIKETINSKETKKQKKSSSKKVKKSESKKKMVRSRSVDNGRFLLKTSVFPILGTRKSKKSMSAASSFKVAPMPKVGSTSASAPMKFGDKDWWRRRSCKSIEGDDKRNGLSSQSMSSRSSSSTSRSNSINGIGRRSNRFLPSCCMFNGRRIESKKLT